MSRVNRSGRPDALDLSGTGNAPADPSRRSVLRGAAGAGVAGLAASTLIGFPASQVLAATRPTARPAPGADHDAGQHAGEAARDVIVHLRDAGSGEMEIFSGTSMTRLRDPDLATRLVRAIR
jgi:hypothetical protein